MRSHVLESAQTLWMNRLFVIVNNEAARARDAWPTVRAQLNGRKVQFSSHETAKAGDATERTRAALREGFETIAVVGGDGTISEVAEGFFDLSTDLDQCSQPIKPSASLAILPAGTGDDFARGLTSGREPLEKWLATLIRHFEEQGGATKPVDVLDAACDGYTKRFICLNASTMGIGGETGARVAQQGSILRRLSGETRFMLAAVGALAAWRERRVRVSVDDEVFLDGPMNLVAVANGLYAGGGMMLSPVARVDDGKLDVVTASGLTRVGVVRELPRIHHGGHVANHKVRIAQGTKVRIETFAEDDGLLIEADGNVRGRTPAEFRVLPLALKVVQP